MAGKNRADVLRLLAFSLSSFFLYGSSAKCGYGLLKAWNAVGSLANNDASGADDLRIGPDGVPAGQTIGHDETPESVSRN